MDEIEIPTKPNEDELDIYRSEISKIDEQLLELVSRRMEYSKKIGQYKIERSMTIKAFDVESRVISKWENLATERGLDRKLGHDLAKTLIHFSCQLQEKHLMTHMKKNLRESTGAPRKALIIGGAGNMGVWFTNFFLSFGYDVQIADHVTSPLKEEITQTDTRSFVKSSGQNDVIVIAAPMHTVEGILTELETLQSKSIIFDISSLKSPLVEKLSSASKNLPGLVSIHPMFGPSADLLVDENILICDLGNSQATAFATELFKQTAANIYVTTPKNHDEIMSEVLGLSHFVNLLFGHVLASTRLSPEEVYKARSTTFNRQLEICADVFSENPDLYFDIQSSNQFSSQLIERVKESIETLATSILNKDRAPFVNSMRNVSQFLSEFERP